MRKKQQIPFSNGLDRGGQATTRKKWTTTKILQGWIYLQHTDIAKNAVCLRRV